MLPTAENNISRSSDRMHVFALSADKLHKASSFGKASSGRTPADLARSSFSSVLSTGSASNAGTPSAAGGGADSGLHAQMHPEADAWQAGFEAGQEAAAWARLPSGSINVDDAMKSPLKVSVGGRCRRSGWQWAMSESIAVCPRTSAHIRHTAILCTAEHLFSVHAALAASPAKRQGGGIVQGRGAHGALGAARRQYWRLLSVLAGRGYDYRCTLHHMRRDRIFC